VALDIVVFDSNPVGVLTGGRLPPAYRLTQVGLVSSWVAGAARMLMLRRNTAVAIGAATWESALPRMVEAARRRSTRIGSVQVWGHGAPGRMLLGPTSEFTVASLRPAHVHHEALVQLREHLVDGAWWWFRGCSVIAGHRGQRFATMLAAHMQVDVVGHTYTIGPYQSGGHAVRPGQAAQDVYDEMEGIAKGTAQKPQSFKMSGADEPNTVFATALNPPAGWWAA
jgi:hypothetical protein